MLEDGEVNNRSHLTNADLTQANLDGADLQGADLSNAILVAAKFDQALHMDKKTK